MTAEHMQSEELGRRTEVPGVLKDGVVEAWAPISISTNLVLNPWKGEYSRQRVALHEPRLTVACQLDYNLTPLENCLLRTKC